MKVLREDLEGTQIQLLVVTDPGDTDHHPGEAIGYLCPECEQADETLDQIWHDEDCSLAGEHGREHYDDLEPVVEEQRATPELQADHPVTMVKAGETDCSEGIHNGEVIAFRCQCGNADEDLFELVHDESCELSGRHGRAA